MKAWTLARYGTEIAVRELPKPSPGPRELLVRVCSASLNHADAKVIGGRDGGKFLHATNFPFALGNDFSGVVEGVGSEPSNHRTGDAVFGFLSYGRTNTQGSYAEYLTVSPSNVARKPPTLSHRQAASCATSSLAALQGLRDLAGLRNGQRILVNGASGGVGGFAVQLAKHAGAEVWATCRAQNIDYVTELGADKVVDYQTSSLASLADGATRRFDTIFDAASVSSYRECAALLEPRGTYVTLQPSMRWLLGKMRSLLCGRSSRLVMTTARTADLEHVGGLLEAGTIGTGIAKTYPVTELPRALQHLAVGNLRGKLTVTVDFSA